MKYFQNKIALVTGSSRGIGRAIALKLAKQGATVIIHYADNDVAAQETINELKGENVFLVKADLASIPGVDTLIAEVDKIIAGNKLDFHINNAGIIFRASMEKISESDFDKMFNINVKAPFFLTARILSRINDGGRIINLSSQVSKRPRYEVGAYAMTKAAIDNFTMSLASILGARKITVNSVAPGIVDTDMNKEKLQDKLLRAATAEKIAMKRIGMPEDIADAVLLLLSEEGRWITGQCIEVSGGAGLIH